MPRTYIEGQKNPDKTSAKCLQVQERSFLLDDGIQGEESGEDRKIPALQKIQTNVSCFFFTFWSLEWSENAGVTFYFILLALGPKILNSLLS